MIIKIIKIIKIMKKQDNKQRLFEVTSRLDKTFKPKLNEEMSVTSSSAMLKTPRPLYEIARDIRLNWKKSISGTDIWFGAKPYLDAMATLDSINDKYGMDSAKSIVLYFLSNASTWRGETAKRIKTELKQMVGLKEEVATSQIDTVPKESGLNEGSSLGTPINKYVYFTYNYPSDFIEQAWADNPNLMEHIKSKFRGYYDKYGAEGVMNRFYVGLDSENQRILEDWILANYKG
jgi:hypothetical protein